MLVKWVAIMAAAWSAVHQDMQAEADAPPTIRAKDYCSDQDFGGHIQRGDVALSFPGYGISRPDNCHVAASLQVRELAPLLGRIWGRPSAPFRLVATTRATGGSPDMTFGGHRFAISLKGIEKAESARRLKFVLNWTPDGEGGAADGNPALSGLFDFVLVLRSRATGTVLASYYFGCETLVPSVTQARATLALSLPGMFVPADPGLDIMIYARETDFVNAMTRPGP